MYGTAQNIVEAGAEDFSHASNSDLTCGDIDFTIEAWVNANSFTTPNIIVAKDDNALGREFIFAYGDGGQSTFTFVIVNNTTQVTASNFGAASTGTWYHVICWYDATANEMGIAVNAGTPNTASQTGGTRPGPGPGWSGAGPMRGLRTGGTACSAPSASGSGS